LGTLIPLIVLPIVFKKVSKKHSEDEYDETIALSSQKLKQVKRRGIPDLDEILKKQSREEESNQGGEISTYRPESVIKDKKTSSRREKSIINNGSKRKKFKTRY
jgi:hypothetical protein